MDGKIIVLLILLSIKQCSFECTEELELNSQDTSYEVQVHDKFGGGSFYMRLEEFKQYDNRRRYELSEDYKNLVVNLTILCSHVYELPTDILYPYDHPTDYEQFLKIQNSSIPTLAASAFSQFTNIAKLYLESIHIRLILPEAFRNLKNLRELYLADNELTAVSRRIFNSLLELQMLDLSNNHIRTIEDFSFMGPSHLKRMFLSKNQLSEVSGGTFQEMQKLEILDLSKNQIRAIGDGAFKGLENLKKVLLSSNQLSEIDGNIFQGIQNLDILDLFQNSIEKFSVDNMTIGTLNLSSNHLQTVDFYELPKFDHADFSHNRISRLENFGYEIEISEFNFSNNNLTSINGAFINVKIFSISHNEIETFTLNFSNSTEILTINLAYNKISSLEENIFEDLFLLAALDLSHNNLSFIQHHLFHDLEGLISLNLSHNQIERFLFGTFNNLKKLSSLDISHNKLLELDHYALNPMSELTSLYFENNQISSLDASDLTTHFINLKKISLADNLWRCQDLTSFSRLFKQRGITLLGGHRFDVENLYGVACNNQVSVAKIIANTSKPDDYFLNKEVNVKVKVNTDVDDSGFVRFFNSSYRKTNFFRYFDNFVRNEVSREADTTKDKLISLPKPPDHDESVSIVSLLVQICIALLLLVMVYTLVFKKFRRDLSQVTMAQDNLL